MITDGNQDWILEPYPPTGPSDQTSTPCASSPNTLLCLNRSSICTSEKPLCFPLLPGPDGSGSLQHLHQRLGKNSRLEKTLTLYLNRFTATAAATAFAPQPACSRADSLTHILPAVFSSGNGVGQRRGFLCVPFPWDHCGIYGNHIKFAVMESNRAKHFKKQGSQAAEKKNLWSHNTFLHICMDLKIKWRKRLKQEEKGTRKRLDV